MFASGAGATPGPAAHRLDRARLAVARLRRRLRRAGEPEPLVSVTIPTFNRGALLAERTLPSVLAQSYGKLEVIVVGDACTDDTAARLAALGDARVRFENLPRQGRYPDDPLFRWMVAGTAAANRTLELVRGQWIAFVDDDDVLEPDHVAALLAHGRSTQAEFVYGAGMFQRSAEEWLRIGAWPPGPGHVMHSAVLYSSELRFLRYDVEAWRQSLGGDAELWLRMVRLGVRFAFLDRVVCSSPLRPGQDLRGQRAAERARAGS